MVDVKLIIQLVLIVVDVEHVFVVSVSAVQVNQDVTQENSVNVTIYHVIVITVLFVLVQITVSVRVVSVNVNRVGLDQLVIVWHRMTLVCHQMVVKFVLDMDPVSVEPVNVMLLKRDATLANIVRSVQLVLDVVTI